MRHSVREVDPEADERFLTELYAFEREIEERAPSFFDYYALRVEADSFEDEFDTFCERVRRLFGSSLLPAAPGDALTEVDRAFASRVSDIHPPVSMDDERLRALHHRLTSARAAREERVASMAGLECIDAGEGTTPIVLLNAIGQGFHYWFRLVDALTPRHRVLAIEPRGSIEDQIRDLETLLARQEAERCILLGWCTGPKVALELYARKPEAVAAMVFLNPTFRTSGTPRELETAYERNSEPLFRAVAARPSMAASVMKSLQASVAGPALDLEGDGDAAAEVLAMMSAALRPHVARPFRCEPVLVEYTRQILDFWAHDSLTKADALDIPLLVVAAELDRVASSEAAREVARRVRGARLVEVPYATHYCLYDRPNFIASVIDDFLANAVADAAPALAMRSVR
jgi:pimeloyl-ACP methyl ester carboxylesterase